jgi:predicted DNA-binding protein
MAVEFKVNFGKKTANFFKYIAECQGKTVPKLIRTLVFEALETREDKYFSKLADERLENDEVVPDSEEIWRTSSSNT